MKELLNILKLFFYQETPYYIINVITSEDLKFSSYTLLHKRRILFFKYLTPIDYCTTIGNKHITKRSEWYKKYNQRLNNKDTIKEIEYFKNGRS